MTYPAPSSLDNPLAEGTDQEMTEPQALRATGEFRLPVRALLTLATPMSATGVNLAVKLQQAEGRDTTDKQDAPMTQDEATAAPDAAPLPARDLAKLPVLIVEDTVELAEVLQATLEGMGMHAQYATHGKVGLEKIKELNPGLVLMDIGLPDITGWKMLDSIKEHYAASHLPLPVIIVITAYGDPANRLIGKLQNIHSYLIKPFTPDEVEGLVRMALRGETPPDPGLTK